jgi:UDPglucose 6-dehydrogenase
MQICVVGSGYVGLVTGVCMAEVGHTVTCVDNNLQKVKNLQDGILPIYEPGLEKLVKRNVEHQRLFFTTDLAKAANESSAVFIAVGTPQGEDGSADLQYVLGVSKEIGKHATRDLLVIVKSTVPVGTCDLVDQALQVELSARKSSLRLTVASNPEFLKEGTAIDDFMKPDRIIVGVKSKEAEDLFHHMYKPFITDDPGKLFIMDHYSSELTKYGANAMLATRISFMNEMSRLCDIVGANIDNIRLGMGADPRIGKKFLYAGPGYGGSCFPKDVQALIKTGERHGTKLEVLEAVSRTNKLQKHYVSDKIKKHFGNLTGKNIAVWGLAFKPGTDDVREAPAITIVEELLKNGAQVSAHDPEGTPNFKQEVGELKGLSYVETAYDALKGADALVLVTEWPEYKRPNWQKAKELMRTPTVFDFRNQYSFEGMANDGFHYECVGRPDSRKPKTTN